MQMQVEKAKPKAEKVISGSVVAKKKGVWARFKQDFLKSDSASVKNYILGDVIIPNIKDAISNGVKAAIDMMLYGEARPASAKKPGILGQKISYTSYYDRYSEKKQPKQTAQRVAADDLVFETRDDAEKVLRLMTEMLSEYKRVSLLDLNDLIGRPTTPSEDHYGWLDLSGADISLTRDGYELSLPTMRVID